jgi:hypothetical protein
MKKYIISVLIPCLLIYLTGCYIMQEVTKEEFCSEPDYPELYVKTKEAECTFEEGSYIFPNDTIYGKGEIILLGDTIEPFDGKISINDIEKIKIEKFSLWNTIAFCYGVGAAVALVVAVVGAIFSPPYTIIGGGG